MHIRRLISEYMYLSKWDILFASEKRVVTRTYLCRDTLLRLLFHHGSLENMIFLGTIGTKYFVIITLCIIWKCSYWMRNIQLGPLICTCPCRDNNSMFVGNIFKLIPWPTRSKHQPIRNNFSTHTSLHRYYYEEDGLTMGWNSSGNLGNPSRY